MMKGGEKSPRSIPKQIGRQATSASRLSKKLLLGGKMPRPQGRNNHASGGTADAADAADDGVARRSEWDQPRRSRHRIQQNDISSR
jgi:hypothetical protein